MQQPSRFKNNDRKHTHGINKLKDTGVLSILEKGRIKLNDLYGEMSLYNSVYIETLKGSNFIQFYL